MIILYSTGCPKCKVLEKKLNAAKIEYEICSDEGKIGEVCKIINTNFVPILQISEKDYLNFSDAVKWVGENVNAD